MFKRKNAVKLLPPTIESFETIIGASTEVHGRIVADESLRIDGKVIGNVEARQGKDVSVAIGRTGFVQGDINAFRVLVAGAIEGNIYASERVELHGGAEVRGDVTYGQIGIEYGAKLNGLMISRTSSDVATTPSDSGTVFQSGWEKMKSRQLGKDEELLKIKQQWGAIKLKLSS